MPSGVFFPIKDKRTGKSYQMPWGDSLTRPTDEDIDEYIRKQEDPSIMETLNTPLLHPSKLIQPFAEGMYNLAGKMGEPGKQTTGLRALASTGLSYAGAGLESLGNIADQTTSPIGAALTLAGPIGKAAPALAPAANFIGRGASALMAGQGAYNVYQDPSLHSVVANAPAIGLGALGMRSGVVKAAAEKLPPSLRDLGKGTRVPETVAPEAPAYEGALNKVFDPKKVPGRYEPPNVFDASLIRETGEAAGKYPQYQGTGALTDVFNPSVMRGERAAPPLSDVFNPAIMHDVSKFEGPESQALMRLGRTRGREAPLGQVGPFEGGESTLGNIEAEQGYTQPGPQYTKRPAPKFKRASEYEPAMTEGERKIQQQWDEYQALKSRQQALRGKIRRSGPSSEGGFLDLGSIWDALSGEGGMSIGGKPVRQTVSEGVSKIPAVGKDVAEAGGIWEGLGESGWKNLEKYGAGDLARKLQRGRLDLKGMVERGEIDLGKNAQGKPVSIANALGTHYSDDIENAINQMAPENQDKARQIINKWTGRTQTPDSAFSGPIKAITKLQSLSKLSQFFIGNNANLGMTFLRGNTGQAAKATWRVLTDYKNAVNEARQTGALHVVDDINNELGGKGGLSKWMDKWFGISKGEESQRTIAAITGKGTAKDLFAKVKAGTANGIDNKRIADLLLEDLDSIRKQSSLTPEQLNRAGARMSEITQGHAESIDLPALWTSSPSTNLITQFKRYSYIQSKNMKDAFKQDPIKFGAALATVFPAIGEIIGDTKAGIKGATKGIWNKEDVGQAIKDEVAGRGEGLDRYFKNLSQAWGLGLMGELYEGSSRGPMGLAETVMGPTVGDLSHAAYNVTRGVEKGNWKPLQRQAARMVPYVGSGLAASIKDEDLDTGPRRRQRRTRTRR